MRRFLAACRVAFGVIPVLAWSSMTRPAGAQVWNDSATKALVQRAIERRAQQFADTGLRDYHATAHGYVSFLAQLGEGFRTPPKLIKSDELESEVYWRAPNYSKQIIVGRRDTLLLPTDIAYHRDHLGIVQNNFPDIIRLGEGDEVRDVPHPLSAVGFQDYDFALADSFSIGSGSQRIHVHEVKVRPKDDTQPRVIGAVYIDPSEGQVVRMNLSFTRAAFIDQALEQLSIILENRLIAGRFWLPSHQEIEIVRGGEWLDYPVRGIIRGRWEIGDYQFNLNPNPAIFTGPEIIQMPQSVLKQHVWNGAILDSLPPDVRAVTDEDVRRVQAEARALVRRQALARARQVSLTARNVSDFARFNRVEGVAIGDGITKPFGGGFFASVRGRYGIDDKLGKGEAALGLTRPDGSSFRLFASRDFRDAGDIAERSGVVNSLAAQEFGSDYTDPFLVRAVGASYEATSTIGWSARFTGSYEWQSALTVHAQPVTGTFQPTIPAFDLHAGRGALAIDRAPGLWLLGTELTLHLAAAYQHEWYAPFTVASTDASTQNVVRAAGTANVELPIGAHRLVLWAAGAGVATSSSPPTAPQDLVYLGGPVSGPGYEYHELVGERGGAAHLEWRMPAPFPAFSLGRFGRVPARATFAPYVHVMAIGGVPQCVSPASASAFFPFRSMCDLPVAGAYPAVGGGFLLPFDVVRFDVARGLRDGRWTFAVDLSREFWSIL